MIAIPATAPMTIPAMAPPPNPLELEDVGVEVGVSISLVVPVLIGVEVPARPVGVIFESSVVEVSPPSEVCAAAVTVMTVTFVPHSSQVSPPPVRTSVAQKAEDEGHVKHACPPVHPLCPKSKHFLEIVGTTIVVE